MEPTRRTMRAGFMGGWIPTLYATITLASCPYRMGRATWGPLRLEHTHTRHEFAKCTLSSNVLLMLEAEPASASRKGTILYAGSRLKASMNTQIPRAEDWRGGIVECLALGLQASHSLCVECFLCSGSCMLAWTSKLRSLQADMTTD